MKEIFNRYFTKIFKIHFIAIFIFFISNLLFATEDYVINTSSSISNQIFENYSQNEEFDVFYAGQSTEEINTEHYIISTSSFISNQTFENYSQDDDGGVFYITRNGTITISSTVFSENAVSYCDGGAICNEGTITISSTVFIGNIGRGGAIYNKPTGLITISSTVFSENGDSHCDGGAICNEGTITISSIVFIGNIGRGGAIYNKPTGLITISSTVFSENGDSHCDGGAIRNTGTITIKDDVKFENNIAKTGGAICNEGTLNLIANINDIEFTGNTASGISNAIQNNEGVINLWANNAKIIFNDRITSYEFSGIININKAVYDLPVGIGKITLNEDMSGCHDTINLYGGEIELKAKTEENSNININKFFSGNINLENGTLNILNNAIDDNIIISKLTTTSNTNLKFDVDLSNNTSDNFTITNNVSGEIKLAAINILGVSDTTGQITVFNNGKSPDLKIGLIAIYDGYEYIFSTTTILGILSYKKGDVISFKNFINRISPEIKSYSLSDDEIVNENLENLGGEELTIFGNNKNIIGYNVDGIYVGKDKILNIENVNNWGGFNNTYGAIKNEGTLNISGTNFSNNEGQDIINNGNLILSDTCYFETGIIGNGISTIDGNIISNGIIKQNEIKIQNNAILKLTNNAILITNNLISNNATIDMANEIIQQHNFKTINITNTLNLCIDVDLVNEQMDTIFADNTVSGIGKINISNINILGYSKENKIEIKFTTSNILIGNITTSINSIKSKYFKYDVEYNRNLGIFSFLLSAKSNPTKVESQVAVVAGGFITQAIINQAFSSIDNIRNRILQVKNEIPVDSPLYASTSNTIFFQKTNRIESGLWLRPFTTQDSISLSNLSVDNTLTGTLAGLDLATGQDSLLSIYLGYAGSQQKYENIKVNQTGYILGLTEMFVKEKWYAGLTGNVTFNKASAESEEGTDDFDMNMYSVGAKAGYNFSLSESFILEPNLMLMYGNVNSAEYKTTQGATVEGQSNANIIFEPQIKAKLDLTNGWQPYGLLGYVMNCGDKVKAVVEGIEFEEQKIENYVEFGVGLDKSFKNSPWSLFLQLTGKSGDRTGFDGNFGIKYSFLTAKEKRKIAKIKKIQAKRKAKEEFLREKKRAELKEQQEIEEENKRIQQEEQEEQRRLEIQRRIKANYEE